MSKGGGSKEMYNAFSNTTILAVLSAVTVGTAAALYYFFRCRTPTTGGGGGGRGIDKKRLPKHYKGPITLQDPDRKYALRMVAREEVSHDTRLRQN
jgi:hypothetical protein